MISNNQSYEEIRFRQDAYRRSIQEYIEDRNPSEQYCTTVLAWTAKIFWSVDNIYEEGTDLFKESADGKLFCAIAIKNNMIERKGDSLSYVEQWGGYTARHKIREVRNDLSELGCFAVEGGFGKDCFQGRRIPGLFGIDLEKLAIVAEVFHNHLIDQFDYLPRTVENGGLSDNPDPHQAWICSHINTVRRIFDKAFEPVGIEWGRQVNEGYMLAFNNEVECPEPPKFSSISEKFAWIREHCQHLKEEALGWLEEKCHFFRDVILGETPEHQETEFCDCTGCGWEDFQYV